MGLARRGTSVARPRSLSARAAQEHHESVATFVLVHGGWSGAHMWRAVRRQLTRRQHDVFTPSLTGIGERAHLVSPQVGLGTHVQDLVNQIVYEDLCEIVLVGYSYGGAVVTGALDAIGDRTRELVYLDAFVPAHGDTVAGLAGRDHRDAAALGANWLAAPPERSYDDPEEGRWQRERRVPNPIRCFVEPVRLSTPIEDRTFGLTFIKAGADGREAPGGNAFWDAAEHAKASPRWRYFEIATTHMVASNRPTDLVAILHSIGSAADRSAGEDSDPIEHSQRRSSDLVESGGPVAADPTR